MKKKNYLDRLWTWLCSPSSNAHNEVLDSVEVVRLGSLDVVLGLQWGDEGKGKIVDVLTPKYDTVARFQGGPNAGHSLEINGMSGVVNQIPSGAFNPGVVLFIGNGCVVDPHAVRKDLDTISSMGGDVSGRLFFSERAKLILPIHIILDKFSEKQKGKDAIGSTLRGITPAYQDHCGRVGLHVGDFYKKDFTQKLTKITNFHKEMIRLQGGGEFLENFDLDELNGSWMSAFSLSITKDMIVSYDYILRKLRQGKNVLAEGAQGSLLDIEIGDYPYVTSSHTTTAGACVGLSVPPTYVRRVYGIIKAYATRVGEGPFPGEILNIEKAEYLREKGHEYGATTGRKRRVGFTHLDLVLQAIRINGVTDLFINKLDVLSDENFPLLEGDSDHPFEKIKFDKNGVPNIYGKTFISFMQEWLKENNPETNLVGVGTSPSRDGIFYC
ncbi:MAG: adenylosuccinate synthetase [Candidatus Pacebacteria bacterium]|nr:adenylosuccinate synthetase [Candidatus Paceibacterota bacterium]MBP9715655.1 adenylosuccinate synthetase [Candidatus Paceibacterota bacterium]